MLSLSKRGKVFASHLCLIPMSVLPDHQIRRIAQRDRAIVPFTPMTVRDGLSWGLSSFGYDARLSHVGFSLITDGDEEIDPKRFDDRHLTPLPLHREGKESWFVLPPRSFGLGVTMEEFAIPLGMIAVPFPKSTYGRAGLTFKTIPAEPGWKGYLTLEIGNDTNRPMRVYAGEGICQIVFFEGVKPELSYADRSGKYQDQPHRPVSARGAISVVSAVDDEVDTEEVMDDGNNGDV